MMTRPRRVGSRISDSTLASTPRQVRQRHLGDHLSPLTWLAGDGAMTAQQRDAFVHAEQADALAWARAILVVDGAKAATPITHFQPDDIVALPERDRHPRPSSMLAHVGKRLLRHAEQRRLDLRRQALVAQILVVGDLPAFAA